MSEPYSFPLVGGGQNRFLRHGSDLSSQISVTRVRVDSLYLWTPQNFLFLRIPMGSDWLRLRDLYRREKKKFKSLLLLHVTSYFWIPFSTSFSIFYIFFLQRLSCLRTSIFLTSCNPTRIFSTIYWSPWRVRNTSSSYLFLQSYSLRPL